MNIWDKQIPDSRIKDESKRGLIRSDDGPFTQLYCVTCHKPAPIASPESMLKVYYVCNDCVYTNGEPPYAIRVKGSEGV